MYEVELAFDIGADDLLVTAQVTGYSAVRTKTVEGRGGPGFVVLQSSPGAVIKRFSAESERLNLRVPRSRLDETWAALTGELPRVPLVFDPFPNDGGLSRRWLATMDLLLTYARAEHSFSRRQAYAVTESALLALLLEFPHSESGRLGRVDRFYGRSERLRRAEEMMRSCLRDPRALTEIASECGVSVRTLNEMFRSAHGTSPMKYLVEQRLLAARAQLSSRRAGTSVTSVALDCGFSGLGRFAALYRERFGERPCKTLGGR